MIHFTLNFTSKFFLCKYLLLHDSVWIYSVACTHILSFTSFKAKLLSTYGVSNIYLECLTWMFMLYIMANLIEGDFTNCFADWGPLVDVVGYCFLNLGSKYQPQDEFVQWIQKGSEPIYIGFGSMVWWTL